jgi:predicted PurR-regulated permease PerM
MLKAVKREGGTQLPITQSRRRAFVGFLIGISLAFVWLLTPFIASVFWAMVLAILFAPLNRWLLRHVPSWPNVAAFLTLLATVLIALLPLIWVGRSVLSEVFVLYQQVQTGRLAIGEQFELAYKGLPDVAKHWLASLGFDDIAAVKAQISLVSAQAVRLVGNRALNIGQNTFMLVVEVAIMLYLLFFLLRDGGKLAELVRQAIPLEDHQKEQFLGKLATVVRATIKGNVAVAVAQGFLGGLVFWLMGIPSPTLWGTLMAVLSLLPAVGAGLVWGPVAIYFFATGSIGSAVFLASYGVLVIGMVDNVLRPLLVGKDVKMPDYLVLISTLGGLVLFGLSGFIAGPLIAALFLVAWDLFMAMGLNRGKSRPS